MPRSPDFFVVEALPVYENKIVNVTRARFEALRSLRVKNPETGATEGCAR